MAAGSASKKTARGAASANDVDDFMRSLDHPLKSELQAVRNIIRGVEPGITEGIKWNGPSFCLRDHFATFNIRADAFLVILHQGAKSTAASANGLTIDDPDGLLEWRGKDRAVVTFSDMKTIKARKAAFEHILRQWIAALP